jgi:hypothetical protein
MDYTTTAVLTVLVVVGGTEATAVISGKPPTFKPVVSGFLLGLFLFTFGLLSESLATKICYLIVAASLLVNGIPLIQAVSGTKTK